MSWKEVSEEMEKIEKIVGQMEEGTSEEQTERETKEKKKRKEQTEVAQVHKEDTSKGIIERKCLRLRFKKNLKKLFLCFAQYNIIITNILLH